MKEAQLLAFHVKVWDGHMRILGKAYPLRIQQGNHGETGQLWSFRYNNPLRLRTCSAQKITSSKRFCIFHFYHQMYMFGNFSWNSRETQGPTSGAHGIFPQRCGKHLKSQGFWRLVTQHGVLPGMAVMALEVAVAMFLWMKKLIQGYLSQQWPRLKRPEKQMINGAILLIWLEKMWGCKQLLQPDAWEDDRVAKIWPANQRHGTGFDVIQVFTAPVVEKAPGANRMNERLWAAKC